MKAGGKVKAQTPRVEKAEKKKEKKGRAKMRKKSAKRNEGKRGQPKKNFEEDDDISFGNRKTKKFDFEIMNKSPLFNKEFIYIEGEPKISYREEQRREQRTHHQSQRSIEREYSILEQELIYVYGSYSY